MTIIIHWDPPWTALSQGTLHTNASMVVHQDGVTSKVSIEKALVYLTDKRIPESSVTYQAYITQRKQKLSVW